MLFWLIFRGHDNKQKMKRVLFIAACVIILQNIAAQPFFRPGLFRNEAMFFITDLNYGMDLSLQSKSAKEVPYANQFMGFTTIIGFRQSTNWQYQNKKYVRLNNNIFAGVGTGLSIYNGGYLIPFYLDFRYWLPFRTYIPFVAAEGGLLFNTKDINHGTRFFMSPKVGMSVNVHRVIAINIGAGLFIQTGDNIPRASFVKYSMGLGYKF
jgi:hypothetical protein